MVDAPGGPVHGTTAGLDSSGVLLLRKEDGSTEPILAGSVRPLPRDAETDRSGE